MLTLLFHEEAGLNWFQKHLNLTVLFAIIVWSLILLLLFVINAAFLIAMYIVGGLLFLALLAWVLRQKGQSLWFMVALLFLWWIIFLIPNKNEVKQTIQYEYDDEPKV